MGRLVPAATAGDETHLSVSCLFGIGPDQDRLARQSSQAGMDRDQPLEHLFHDAVRIVDQLLHREGLPVPSPVGWEPESGAVWRTP